MGTLSYKDTSSPIVEPLTLTQVKAQCNVDDAFTADDVLLTGLISAARTYCEHLTQRAFFSRTMRCNLDHFPWPWWGPTVNPADRHSLYGNWWHKLAINLPKPGTHSVQSIKYIDLAGNIQTLATSAYFTDFNSEPARIVPPPGTFWPYQNSYLPGSVQIDYTAGTYDHPHTDTLTVSSTSTVTLSIASQLAAGTILLTSVVTLVDANGNPVDFTIETDNGILTVTGPAVGATLTASYYAGMVPQGVAQAMLMLCSYWYTHRDAAESNPPKAIEHAVQALLAEAKFETFGFID
jgi:Phage gp6-like head-tail connector protein